MTNRNRNAICSYPTFLHISSPSSSPISFRPPPVVFFSFFFLPSLSSPSFVPRSPSPPISVLWSQAVKAQCRAAINSGWWYPCSDTVDHHTHPPPRAGETSRARDAACTSTTRSGKLFYYPSLSPPSPTSPPSPPSLPLHLPSLPPPSPLPLPSPLILLPQAARVTRACTRMKKVPLEIRSRPYNYTDTPQLDLDSVVTFSAALNMSVSSHMHTLTHAHLHILTHTYPYMCTPSHMHTLTWIITLHILLYPNIHTSYLTYPPTSHTLPHSQAKLISIPVHPALVAGLFFVAGLTLFIVFQYDTFKWAKWL